MEMFKEPQIPRIDLNMICCLGERDQETGLFLYHCLNFDLIESGTSWEDAWRNLKLVVKAHVEHCYARNPSGLLRAAARNEWEEFGEVLKRTLASDPQSVVVESIDIELKAPLPAEEIPLWIQGVNSQWRTLHSLSGRSETASPC